ncbi:MAG TPA: choice-of-anchor Q domain-containing protein [Solirubrobacteraceae bacterium]|jgi:CSLREA domain-containing protein
MRTACGGIVATIAAFVALAPAAQAATITVTTTADTLANDGVCSLREALTAAATDLPSGSAAGECVAGSGPDTIVLPAGAYVLSRTGVPDDTNVNGDLDVTAGTVTIVGAGQSLTKIDANGIDRVLDVLPGATLTLENVTVTGGKLPIAATGTAAGAGSAGGAGAAGGASRGGSGNPGEGGGGVRNAGTLVLNDVTVTGNHAGAGGTGGTASNGGKGGAGTTGAGGAGGGSFGGGGGEGGNGGGVLNAGGTLTVSASTFTEDFAGAAGAGGSGANGGEGGAGATNSGGGEGGPCFGGFGGQAGRGGAIAAVGGSVTISGAIIEHNAAGAGGTGGSCGSGGSGGAGNGTGGGGRGAFAFGGDGSEGGSGGGVSDTGAALSLSDSTIGSNTAAPGGNGSSAASGGNGGAGAATGGGGFEVGGSGGEGGFGGGVSEFESGVGPATVALEDDTLVANTAGAGGAGVAGTHGGNGASSDGGQGGEGGAGGGAYLGAEFTASDVTVTANVAASGGDGGAGGSGPAQSSGGSGGEGGFAGGLYGEAGALAHATLIGNQDGAGGVGGAAGSGTPATAGEPGSFVEGPDLASFGFTPTVTLSASIAGLCGGEIGDGGGNIAGPAVTPCPGLVAAPDLLPLANNGGPTETMALAPASPAVNRIAAPCGTTPDQRGVPRPQGSGCDAGAYELAPPTIGAASAAQIAKASASVGAAITPNDRATTWDVQFGPTSAYGSTTPIQALPAGLAAVDVSASLSGLPAHTTIHYRLVATSADGTAVGPDTTFTTAGFTGLQIAKRTFTASKKGRVAVTLTCPASALRTCSGTLTMSVKVISKARHKKPKTTTVTLAHVSFKIASGAHKTLQLLLGSKARARLRAAGKKGLTIKLSASAKDASGERASTTLASKLKRAAH